MYGQTKDCCVVSQSSNMGLCSPCCLTIDKVAARPACSLIESMRPTSRIHEWSMGYVSTNVGSLRYTIAVHSCGTPLWYIVAVHHCVSLRYYTLLSQKRSGPLPCWPTIDRWQLCHTWNALLRWFQGKQKARHAQTSTMLWCKFGQKWGWWYNDGSLLSVCWPIIQGWKLLMPTYDSWIWWADDDLFYLVSTSLLVLVGFAFTFDSGIIGGK